MAFGNPIVGGSGGELIRASIKSPDYVPNVSGWTINRDGSAEFRNVIVQGTIVLSPGQVTNTEIANGAVTNSKITDVVVDKVTAGTTQQDWTLGSRIKTADTGTRVEISNQGFQAFSGVVQTVDISAATGDVTIVGTVSSANFSSGVSGWQINDNGSAEFNNLVARGELSTGFTPATRLLVSDGLGPFNGPAVDWYINSVDSGTNPATIQGFDNGSGQVGIQVNTSIHGGLGDQFAYLNLNSPDEVSLISNELSQGYSLLADSDPEVGYQAALSPYGLGALRGDSVETTLCLPVDGRVASGTNTTAIGTTDTNITAANAVNVPVIADRAYLAIVQIDYFRASTGALARLEMKLWNGAVGGTQLGGTVRIAMTGGLNTQRRQALGMFVWRASSTEIIANLNVSLSTNDGTGGQNWTAETNSSYMILVQEFGFADNISNL